MVAYISRKGGMSHLLFYILGTSLIFVLYMTVKEGKEKNF